VVLDTIPHDASAFTQGFEMHDGLLWEGTGLYGSSEIRITDPITGEVIASSPLPDSLFGEGITHIRGSVYQLTWQSGVVLRWNPATLEATVAGFIGTQGWGLCSMGDSVLVTSEGSSILYFRDPETLGVLRTVLVSLQGVPQWRLNELEYAGGFIWANQWDSDRVLKIDPQNGSVVGIVFAPGLLDAGEAAASDVMNGIAWDPAREAFLITGKLWPWTFVVRFEPRQNSGA
jgi:glutamine cyclotransferase